MSLKPILPAIRGVVQATVKKLVMQILPKVISFVAKRIMQAVTATGKMIKKRMDKKINTCMEKMQMEKDEVLVQIRNCPAGDPKEEMLKAQADVWEKAIEILKGELGNIDEIFEEAEQKIRVEIEEVTSDVSNDKEVEKKIDDLISKKDFTEEEEN